jgi:hypothetical protein
MITYFRAYSNNNQLLSTFDHDSSMKVPSGRCSLFLFDNFDLWEVPTCQLKLDHIIPLFILTASEYQHSILNHVCSVSEPPPEQVLVLIDLNLSPLALVEGVLEYIAKALLRVYATQDDQGAWIRRDDRCMLVSGFRHVATWLKLKFGPVVRGEVKFVQVFEIFKSSSASK